MLEVHVPHKAIANIRQFLFHLFTITCGLLIAVGIERFVDWRHHQQVLAEARETLRGELELNARRLDKAIADIEKATQMMHANLAAIDPFITGTAPKIPTQEPSLGGNFTSTELSDTSWRTAQATGAINYMTYDEAERYSLLYSMQADFIRRQEPVADDLAQFIGLARKFVHKKTFTEEQAREIAERIGTWEGHLVALGAQARTAAEHVHAFLEGRPTPESKSEKLELK